MGKVLSALADRNADITQVGLNFSRPAVQILAQYYSFIPPSHIDTGSSTVWYSVLITGCVVMVVIPYVIYALRKPSWRDSSSEFAQFHWEKH